MKRKWLPHPWLTLLLTVVWLLLVNHPGLGDLLLGLFLGWLIPLLTRNFLLDVPPVRKPFKLCLFVLMVFYDIVVANLHVARLVLGPRKNLNPAFVVVPMAIENGFLLAALTSIISLTPGTVSAGLSPDHRTLLLHGLDVTDADALVAGVKKRYEAPLLEIFECSSM
ncbi:Na+/H+ antiporter subunit E [Stutzerimonas kirkiae]|uniref:Na+/H+ antiporter subunit E n=1 Tax=Stutzerimonas kirkiae TaxID=2211392 RepID=A0A4Q9R649_9GAMM|nr:Na+/H+ antiporter subunit E [Stutzerimonas kirkiae]TBU95500.1 Na+/H+ antiporter subunit E [Stutzerimonas kirkiae]TBV02558.1 Na+/H+ antiporter subunit E [Stutzerimonas kirkiae]TBV09225.1 Na+/H+ antiporter subunit E [Stutzerimonas kirkiae]TBV12204.1 Na+/H+ antiporter subunit E [Stutzerimonas kirkiae]